jgi:hypothetical protein
MAKMVRIRLENTPSYFSISIIKKKVVSAQEKFLIKESLLFQATQH